MIDWKPISEMVEKPANEGVNLLLWFSNLRVSGPAIVCYWQNQQWCVALTGEPVPDVSLPYLTHYAIIDEP